MMGTLKKIKITEDLVMEVARVQYARCNEGGVLDEQREYVRVGWVVGASEILEDFNTLVGIFKKLKIDCCVENFGCGHDVEEFYKE